MENINLGGKTALVTGATNGIGLVTARELARMGATVVVAGRNPEKTERVVNEIRAATGNERVNKAVADLSALDDIREMADAFKTRYDRLDILVNNAGAIFNKRQESPDGYELTFALNHLGYFLLTNLLLDLLKASAPARIVSVSSGAHHFARGGMRWHDLQFRDGYSATGAYGQSKLANIMFTHELARRLEGTGVTANAMHPGFVASGFGRNNSGIMDFFYRLIAPLARTPERGADTIIYLAAAPEVAGVTGEYFEDRKPASLSKAAQDPEAAARLWAISEQMTGLAETETA
jgi:NAD(P)-dependent dehydrogenase (short-subunit alcohol dehydrogenase family)